MTHARQIMNGVLSIVLKPDPSEETLFERLEHHFESWRRSHDLAPIHDETLEGESGITSAIWRDPARPGFEFRLVFDDVTPMTYLSLTPDERTDAASILRGLRGEFPAESVPDLRQKALQCPDDLAAWTRFAIASDSEPDADILAVLTQNLVSGDSDRVAAAIMAAALFKSPRLLPALQEATTRPVPEDLRAPLNAALLACQSHA